MVAWFSQRYTMGENNFSSLLDRKKIGRNWAYRSKQSTKTIFSAKYGSKNFEQHKAFLDEVIGTPMHKEIIEWFLTLPLWLELDGIRAVHACWHKPFMEYLAPKLADGNRLTRELMGEACREPANEQEKDSPEPSIFKAVEASDSRVGRFDRRHPDRGP